MTLISFSVLSGQTTFTENSAVYNLNIAGTKDGGHAWADYDLVVNTNGSGYLA